MKITLCGSIAFIDEMKEIGRTLEALGHEVKMPPLTIRNEHNQEISVKEYYAQRKNASVSEKDVWLWQKKGELIKEHFVKVAWSEAILVLNYEKNGVSGYVGANTLLEMGLAFYLDKPIYLLFPVPNSAYKEEIWGMHPVVIDNDLTRLAPLKSL